MARLFALIFLFGMVVVASAESTKPSFGFQFSYEEHFVCNDKESCENVDPAQIFIGKVIIISVLCGSSPYKQGIRAGDRIVGINAVPIHNMTLRRFEEITKDIDARETILLTIVRVQGEELYGGNFTLTRDGGNACPGESDL